MKPGMTMSPVASMTSSTVGGQVHADGDDLVVLDEDVGPGQLAELGILGQDISTLDEQSVGHRSFPRVRSVVFAWSGDVIWVMCFLLMADRSRPALLTQVARNG